MQRLNQQKFKENTSPALRYVVYRLTCVGIIASADHVKGVADLLMFTDCHKNYNGPSKINNNISLTGSVFLRVS